MEKQEEQLKQAHAFVAKLNGFMAELEPHEQAMLVSLVGADELAADDVTGFGSGPRASDSYDSAVSSFGLDPASFGQDPKSFGMDPFRFALDPKSFGMDPFSFGIDTKRQP